MTMVSAAEQRWLMRKYLAYQFLSNLFFIAAIWLYFYRLFITDEQVGILDGVSFAVGLIAEVPSGALADRFGRDKMVKLGLLLTAASFFMHALGNGFVPFFVGQTIFMIGMAFVSGADEALFFEKLQFSNSSAAWKKLVARGSQIELIGLLAATVVGGWLYTMNPRIPWVLTGLAFFGVAILIWPIRDVRPKSERQKFSGELRDHLYSIRAGFAQFAKSSLVVYVPIIIAVQGLFYMTGWGLLRLVLLDRFHFSPNGGAVAIASCSLLSVGLLSLVHKYGERWREDRVFTTIALSAALALLVSIFDIGMWGYFVILALYVGSNVLYPFVSEVLNTRADKKHHATVLSVASFLKTVPYVFLAPIIGYLNAHGNLSYFLGTWAIGIVLALLLYRIGSIRIRQQTTQSA